MLVGAVLKVGEVVVPKRDECGKVIQIGAVRWIRQVRHDFEHDERACRRLEALRNAALADPFTLALRIKWGAPASHTAVRVSVQD